MLLNNIKYCVTQVLFVSNDYFKMYMRQKVYKLFLYASKLYTKGNHFLPVLLFSDPHASTSSLHSHRKLCPFVVSAVVVQSVALSVDPAPLPPFALCLLLPVVVALVLAPSLSCG